jgi:hypothetical protein
VDQVISYLEPDEDGDLPEANGQGDGQRMMELRLQLMDGRITREEYWRAVDAERPQEVANGRRAP